MANEEIPSETRLEEGAPELANGISESTSKVAPEEVEDKVNDLTLDEPQGNAMAPPFAPLIMRM